MCVCTQKSMFQFTIKKLIAFRYVLFKFSIQLTNCIEHIMTCLVQVMAKASKVIPVMLMGKLVSKKTYETYEYVTALMISAGLSMFLLTSGDSSKHNDNVTTYRLSCLCLCMNLETLGKNLTSLHTVNTTVLQYYFFTLVLIVETSTFDQSCLIYICIDYFFQANMETTISIVIFLCLV